jgi:hypothetical protein
MASNGKPQFLRQIFPLQSNGAAGEAVDAAVRQDKARISSARIPTAQPAAETKSTRAHPLGTSHVHSHNRTGHTQHAVKVTLWVKPRVKTELEQTAAAEGLSLSAVGAGLLEHALQHSLTATYAPLLEPVIRQTIRTEMRGIATRLSWILVRVAFDAGQTRAIATNILGKIPGVTEEQVKTILAMSQRTAKGNITRKTPQITALIDAVEKWLIEAT